ncbi:MAG: hypothetical protein AAGH90_07800 [Pseudomonadota bacterium]
MIQVIKTVFYFGPLLFAFGFIVPLVSQLVQLAGWTPPLGLSPLMFGLIVGGTYGLIGQIRGRWI